MSLWNMRLCSECHHDVVMEGVILGGREMMAMASSTVGCNAMDDVNRVALYSSLSAHPSEISICIGSVPPCTCV